MRTREEIIEQARRAASVSINALTRERAVALARDIACSEPSAICVPIAGMLLSYRYDEPPMPQRVIDALCASTGLTGQDALDELTMMISAFAAGGAFYAEGKGDEA